MVAGNSGGWLGGGIAVPGVSAVSLAGPGVTTG